jgi:hypothetical protein
MKKFTLIILALVTVFTISCKKDKDVRKNSDYYLSANKNNASWTSPSFNGQATTSSSQQLTAGVYPIQNSYYTKPSDNEIIVVANVGEEHLYIYLLESSPNAYQLNKAKTSFYITVGQDAVSAKYVLDESQTNTANITNINISKKTISGNFILNFKKANGHESYPTTIAFTDGKFHLTTTNN